MNPYLEALQPKLSPADYQKLSAIDNPNVHEFIAKASDLCHAEKIFICSDSAEDIAHVRTASNRHWRRKSHLNTCQGTPFTSTANTTKDETAKPPSTLCPEEFL